MKTLIFVLMINMLLSLVVASSATADGKVGSKSTAVGLR